MRKHNHTSFILPKNGADKKVFLSAMIKSFLRRMAQMCHCFLTKCTIWVHEDKNTKQMSHCVQERGRSMVEMLGVLAIIGVLSVGGIAGYSKAMFKHKTNQTIDIVSRVLMNVAELPTNTVFGMDEAIKIGILDGLSCNTASCQLPIPGWTFDINSSLIDIKLGGSKSDRIEFCIDFLSHHWENMLPDYISSIISLTYNGNLYPVYNNADRKSYDLSDIQDACKKSCDNDIFCYIYIYY